MEDAARALIENLTQRKMTVVTAESCTGGLLAAALTDIPGSSIVVDRGFITYTNASKKELLGVPKETLDSVGAVSRETAEAMALGALAQTQAELSIAITGIAGPTGGTAEKPVGLVHFAAASRAGKLLHHEKRFGDIGRSEVRRRSVLHAIAMLTEVGAG